MTTPVLSMLFLIWVTNDTVALQRFAERYDQYKDMASERYGVPYEEVTDDMRYRGKTTYSGVWLWVRRERVHWLLRTIRRVE